MSKREKLSRDSLYNPVGREVGLTAECPNCGELIPVFGHSCGYCGYKVRLEFIAEESEHREVEKFEVDES